MKKFHYFVFLIIPLLLTGCNQSKSKPKDKDKDYVELESSISSKSKFYKIPYEYKDSYFEHSATVFDDDLKLLSFASCMSTVNKPTAEKYFNSLSFKDTQYYGFDLITSETIGYVVAHKTVKDFELFTVSVRGLKYTQEWANNFLIGSTGNHQGFSDKASDILSVLNLYIEEYGKDKTVKLWITGYSRGGGVSNAVAFSLMENPVYGLNKDNLFVYTFEAPGAIAKDDVKVYENVFNLVNSRDFVGHVPPKQYELFRCGIDIETYSNNYSSWAKSFDRDIIIPKFTKSSGQYTNEMEFVSYLYSNIATDPHDVNYPEASLLTREDYYNNYQAGVTYLLEFIFGLSDEESAVIMDYFKNHVTAIISAISEKDGLYNLLAPVLDENHISYDSEKLKVSTYAVRNLVAPRLVFLMSLVDFTSMSIKQEIINNVKCIICPHYGEAVYILISNQKFAK